MALQRFWLVWLVAGVVWAHSCANDELDGVDAECTSGFASREKLSFFATLVNPDETFTEANNRVRQQRIIPGINFTCNGQITKWIVGARHPGEGRNYFPDLQVWRRNTTNGIYKLVGNTTIRVDSENPTEVYEYPVSPPLDFQPGDVLGIFQPRGANNFLRVYFEVGSGPTNYYFRTNRNLTEPPFQEFSLEGKITEMALPQIAIETSGDEAECTCGFISVERLLTLRETKGSQIQHYGQQRVIPDMNFTCNGYITKWTVVAQWDPQYASFPKLQIWRDNGGNEYTLVNTTTLYFESEVTSYTYEYLVEPPIQFKIGDVLGIFHPPEDSSRLRLYYETDNGPTENYFLEGVDQYDSRTFAINTTGISTDQDLPLITAEIDIIAPTSTLPAPSTTSESPQLSLAGESSSTLPAPSTTSESPQPSLAGETSSTLPAPSTTSKSPQLSLAGETSSTLPAPSTTSESPQLSLAGETSSTLPAPSTTSESPQLSVTGESSLYQPPLTSSSRRTLEQSSPSSLGGETSLFTLGFLGSTGPVSSTHVSPSKSTTAVTVSSSPKSEAPISGESSSQNSAAVYAGVSVGVILGAVLVLVIVAVVLGVLFKRRAKSAYTVTTGAFSNPVYDGVAVTGSRQPETSLQTPPCENEYELISNEHDFDNPVYGEWNTASSELYETVGSVYESWGAYVPTEEQRQTIGVDASAQSNKDDLCIYSSLRMEPQSSSADPQQPLVFFEENNIYWVPSSSHAELFGQLSRFKYREIWRQQISTREELGSGVFGIVYKGKWASPTGPVEVAVKTLKEQSSDKDRVKFLQEAAIMGQFHHPNVVTLHGVVTVREPFMIVLELMVKGDLRQFLIRQEPSPGEMASDDLQRQCLTFCQQIACGMVYLSRKGFVHRDLAARNMLLTEDNTCKIADFGMARDLEDENYYSSQGGMIPVKWTAPEALHYKKYSTASDVWSYGAVMYEIWSLGHKPFKGYNNKVITQVLEKGYRLPPPAGCPRPIYQIMIDCWHPETGSRPSFSDLLQSLSRPETELLSWTEEDTKTHPQATVLGGPLDAGAGLYTDLQNTYILEA